MNKEDDDENDNKHRDEISHYDHDGDVNDDKDDDDDDIAHKERKSTASLKVGEVGVVFERIRARFFSRFRATLSVLPVALTGFHRYGVERRRASRRETTINPTPAIR